MRAMSCLECAGASTAGGLKPQETNMNKLAIAVHTERLNMDSPPIFPPSAVFLQAWRRKTGPERLCRVLRKDKPRQFRPPRAAFLPDAHDPNRFCVHIRGTGVMNVTTAKCKQSKKNTNNINNHNRSGPVGEKRAAKQA